MDKLNRRKFLQVAGASTAVAAGVAVPSAGLLAGNATQGSTVTFRAVAGLPARPLPSYASYVVEGHVDLAHGSGVMTKMVFAGSPETISTIALPGMSRIARITSVKELGDTLRITGMVDDRSQLQRGENPEFSIIIDRTSGNVQAVFFGKEVTLLLES
jgi:hypothetical protein